jgi:hypothetical protein
MLLLRVANWVALYARKMTGIFFSSSFEKSCGRFLMIMPSKLAHAIEINWFQHDHSLLNNGTIRANSK